MRRYRGGGSSFFLAAMIVAVFNICLVISMELAVMTFRVTRCLVVYLIIVPCAWALQKWAERSNHDEQ